MKSAALLLLAASLAIAAPGHSADARLNKSFRKPVQAGWIFVHLEGKPSEIGYQHGFLLAPEILDAQKAIKELLKDLGLNPSKRIDPNPLANRLMITFMPGCNRTAKNQAIFPAPELPMI